MSLLCLAICDELKDNAIATVGLIKQFNQVYTLVKSQSSTDSTIIRRSVNFTEHFFKVCLGQFKMGVLPHKLLSRVALSP